MNSGEIQNKGLSIGFFGRISSGKSSTAAAFASDNEGKAPQQEEHTEYPVYIYADAGSLGEITIIDTPGTCDGTYDDPSAVEKCTRLIGEISAALIIVDCTAGFTREDEFVYKLLASEKVPTLIVMNKSDQCLSLGRPRIDGEEVPQSDILYVSALYRMGVEELRLKVSQMIKDAEKI